MLDPLNITPAVISGSVSCGDLPELTQEQVDFGFVPDASALKAGDLILIEAVQPTGGQRLIASAQEPNYTIAAAPHKKWTHAAIYIKDWRVIEATPKDHVAHGNMLSWVPRYRIQVRRPTFFLDKTAVEADMLGMSLALEAALQLGVARYGLWSALLIYLRLKFPNLRVTSKYSETHADSVVCSGLYAKCFQIAAKGQNLLPDTMLRNDEPITPLRLSKLSSLYDVEVGWKKLAP